MIWMPVGKLESRAGADSRWREGVFLGPFHKSGAGANDYAIGTPGGVEMASAIELVPKGEEWNPELLLSVKGFRGIDGGRTTRRRRRRACAARTR